MTLRIQAETAKYLFEWRNFSRRVSGFYHLAGLIALESNRIVTKRRCKQRAFRTRSREQRRSVKPLSALENSATRNNVSPPREILHRNSTPVRAVFCYFDLVIDIFSIPIDPSRNNMHRSRARAMESARADGRSIC